MLEMAYISGTEGAKKWGAPSDLIHSLKHIDSLSGVVHIAHNVALTETGDIYRWGNIYGLGCGVRSCLLP